MKRLFIGHFFVFLNFFINFNSARVGFIPDFIGYYFIYLGLKELLKESEYFERILPFVLGMGVYSVITYGLDLSGLSVKFESILLVTHLIASVLFYMITYSIIMGIKDIETKRSADLASEKLKKIWQVILVLEILTLVLMMIPTLSLLSIITIITAFVLRITYLFVFNKTKYNFELLLK